MTSPFRRPQTTPAKETDRKALVIGATGATGQALLPLLIAAPAVERIDSFGRRAPDLTDAKLHSHIIDFHQPQQWADKIRGDAVFICLGTTLKVAGSKATQWQIDYQAALDFARAARHNGASTLVLVSAAGANARSPFFYPRMKGALEEAITALGYPRLRICRPPLLIRPDSDRPGERISVRILHSLNAIGLLRSQRPLPVADLARALLAAALDSQDGVKTCSPKVSANSCKKAHDPQARFPRQSPPPHR